MLCFCYIQSMDVLNDLLKHAGLKSKVLGHRSLTKSTSIEFPCNRSIGFHVVTYGQAFIHTKNKMKPLLLNKGDIALMARGCDHIVSTDDKISGRLYPISEFSKNDEPILKPKLSLVSGAYQLWNDPVHSFFSEIPDWYILRNEEVQSFGHLQLMISLLSEETLHPQMGSERIIQGLLDVMFSLIIRKIVEKSDSKKPSFSSAIQDLEIRKSIELMHSDFSRNWSLEELAKACGLSRAGYALKFKKIVGDTPLHYLMTLRIQAAMDLLSSTDSTIETIAQQVGYQDAFGFSKAFKKMTGKPPREFRAQDLSERQAGIRF
jgi:AraC-like DNA-binding protein